VASFTIYQEAERAVDLLSDRGFPVERIAIIGRDLQLVEQVTGRMGCGQAALRGALQGAVLGLLFGWLFGLFNWIDRWWPASRWPSTAWCSGPWSARCSACSPTP
jgi:hypothetical protein